MVNAICLTANEFGELIPYGRHMADARPVGRSGVLILDTASGKKSKSEEHGFGADEFAPWQLGAVM